MKIWLLVATALAFGAAAGVGTAVQAADAPPPWAYGFTTPVPPGTPPAEPNPQQVLDNVTLHTLPGSKFSFTRAEIANRLPSSLWALVEAAPNQVGQTWIQVGGQPCQIGLANQHGCEHFSGRFPMKRLPAAQHFVQHDAKRKDVGAMIGRKALGLFR